MADVDEDVIEARLLQQQQESAADAKWLQAEEKSLVSKICMIDSHFCCHYFEKSLVSKHDRFSFLLSLIPLIIVAIHQHQLPLGERKLGSCCRK